MNIRAAVVGISSQYDTANSTYSTFELADTFVSNIWTYLLVFLVFGVGYWAWLYSQRKGEPMVVYS